MQETSAGLLLEPARSTDVGAISWAVSEHALALFDKEGEKRGRGDLCTPCNDNY